MPVNCFGDMFYILHSHANAAVQMWWQNGWEGERETIKKKVKRTQAITERAGQRERGRDGEREMYLVRP